MQNLLRWGKAVDAATKGQPITTIGPGEILAAPGTGPIAGLFMTPKGAVGSFGGELAAWRLAAEGHPAAKEALELAARMKDARATPAQIWTATGKHFKDAGEDLAGVVLGPDGKWRFEFNDLVAWQHPLPLPPPGQSITFKLGDVVPHETFYKAYPDARDMKVTIIHNPNYNPNLPRGFFDPGPPAQATIVHKGITDRTKPFHPDNIAGHEIWGHGPQRWEGHARGASKHTIPQSLIDQLRDDLEKMTGRPGLPRGWSRQGFPDDDLRLELYLRHYGEIEARNVALRLPWTLPQRRRTSSLRTEDVKDAPIVLRDVDRVPGFQIEW